MEARPRGNAAPRGSSLHDLAARGDVQPAARAAGDQPGPLAYASLYARPLALVFPGRFRRTARQPGRAGRTGRARTGRGLHRYASLRGDLRGDGGGAVRFHLVMDGPAGHRLGGGIFGADLVVRAPCPSALPRDGRHAVDSHRADRRQLHQHPHREALRPRPGRTRGRARRHRRPHHGASPPVPARDDHDDAARHPQQRASSSPPPPPVSCSGAAVE